MRAIEPAKSGKPARTGKSAGEKGGVGNARHRGKRGGHRVERALRAELRERGEWSSGAVAGSLIEAVESGAVGDEQDEWHADESGSS